MLSTRPSTLPRIPSRAAWRSGASTHCCCSAVTSAVIPARETRRCRGRDACLSTCLVGCDLGPSAERSPCVGERLTALRVVNSDISCSIPVTCLSGTVVPGSGARLSWRSAAAERTTTRDHSASRLGMLGHARVRRIRDVPGRALSVPTSMRRWCLRRCTLPGMHRGLPSPAQCLARRCWSDDVRALAVAACR